MVRRTIDRWNGQATTLGAFVYIVCFAWMVAMGHAQPAIVNVEEFRNHLLAGTVDLANTGRDIVVADFNGDGIDDVAISGPRDQSPRGIIRTGRVSIFFGGDSFLNLMDIVRIGDGQASVEIFGVMNDRIGRHVAAGDFNGDTFAYLVITAQDDPGDGARLDFENEKVYVIFGGAMLPRVIQMPAGANAILQRNLSHFTDVAIGDMNGDGIGDLVVADDLSDDVRFPPTPTRNHGPNDTEFNGGAYVVYGRPAAEWMAEVDLATQHDLFIGRDNGAGVFQPQSLAFGNINADRLPPAEPPPPAEPIPPDSPIPPTTAGMPNPGEDLGNELQDLVIGASQESIVALGLEKAGQVFVLYGREIFRGPIEVDMDMDVTIQGELVDDQLGDALAVGDVNGDMFDDILMGAPESGLGVVSTSGVGKAHLLLGRADLAGIVDLFTAPNTEIAYSMDARNIDTKTGEALEIADLNKDGFGDMIISAPSDPPSFNNSGAVYVILGGEIVPNAYQINLEANLRFEAPLPPALLASGRLGSSLGVGDFDADGVLDLIMGAPEGNFPSPGLPPNETDLAGSGWATVHLMPVPPEPEDPGNMNPMPPAPPMP